MRLSINPFIEKKEDMTIVVRHMMVLNGESEHYKNFISS